MDVARVELRRAVEDYTEGKHFDAAVRVKVGTITEIEVPVDDIDWAPYRKPEFKTLWRHSVEVVEVYDGAAPDVMVIVSDDRLPNLSLDPGRGYILFVSKAYASRDELNEHSSKEFSRWYLNSGQLAAVGGDAWSYYLEQVWLIDGDNAWQVTEDRLWFGARREGATDAHMKAALASGVSLLVRDLEASIAAGAARSADSPRIPRIFVKPAAPPTQTPHPPLPTRLAQMAELDRKLKQSGTPTPSPTPKPPPTPRSRAELEDSLRSRSSVDRLDAVVRGTDA